MSWDRLRDAIWALIEAFLGPRLDYLARYPARVVEQDANDTLHVVPDDPRIPGMTGVPIYTGVAGVKVRVDPGARVLIGFSGGRGRYPFAEVWESGTPTRIVIEATEVLIGGPDATRGVARLGDTAGPYAITSASSKVKAE